MNEKKPFPIKRRYENHEYDNIAGLYNIGCTIGKGHFAVVKEAKHVFTDEKVAIKIIDKTKLDCQAKEHLFSEVMCMKLVQHPNVVRLYEVIDTATKLYLVLELGDGGDLYDYIMKFDNGLSEVDARKYFRQIIHATSYCHKLHVVHRDLKPENVVFFEKLGLVKLTDFGFSNKFIPGQTLETSCGSLAYSAPEILLGDAYDAPKIDVWSLGVLLFMLVSGKLPFDETNDSETLSRIMDCQYEFPSTITGSCKNLIRKMLVRDPVKRANLEEIIHDKWLETGAKDDDCIQNSSLPLISRECLTMEEHLEILNKMSEGNLATVDEIQSTLDINEYSYITATYFLLAERKLKRRYIEEYWKMKIIEMENEPRESFDECSESEINTSSCIGSVANNDATEDRFRRFSMILEDEEDEEEEEEYNAMFSLATVREELKSAMEKANSPNPCNGITAPNPSRSVSRTSTTNEIEPISLKFRPNPKCRSLCKSAVYNKVTNIYPSRSLSSIPNTGSNLEDNVNEYVQSSNSFCSRQPHLFKQLSFGGGKTKLSSNFSVIPRFQRNSSVVYSRRSSAVLSLLEPFTDDNISYNSRHRPSLHGQQMISYQTASKRRSFPALFYYTGNLSHSQSSSDVSENDGRKYSVSRINKSLLLCGGTAAQQKFNSTSTSSIASENLRYCPNNKRKLRLRSSSSRPNSMGATMGVPFEELQILIANANKPNITEEKQSSTSNNPVTNSPTVANITLHRDICAPIHEEEELIRSRSYIDKDTNNLESHNSKNLVNLTFRSMSVEHKQPYLCESGENTPHKWPLYRPIATKKSTQSNKSNSVAVCGNSPLQNSHKTLSSQHLTQSNFSLSSIASSLRDSRVMMNVIRGAFELQQSSLASHNVVRSSNSNAVVKGAAELNGGSSGGGGAGNGNQQNRPMSMSANASGRESQCGGDFTNSLSSLPVVNHRLIPSSDDADSLLLATTTTTSPFVKKSHTYGTQIHCNHNTCQQSSLSSSPLKKSLSSQKLIDRVTTNISRKSRFIFSCCFKK